MNKAIIKDYSNYLSNKERLNLIDKFESNFQSIVEKLGLDDDYPAVIYHLYPSEKIKIQEMGEDGYAETDRKKHIIYMVYNQDIQPIGPHELVHILTNKLNTPNYVFNEGLAEYFEDSWRADIDGVPKRLGHDEWVKRFLKEGTYVSIDILFDDNKFWKADESAMLSYPESGSFLKYLAKQFGLERVMQAFIKLKRRPTNKSFNHDVFLEIFKRSVAEAESEWLSTLS